ncbi:MAG: hypothetical protein ACKO40_15535 [Planctomycetaceae bacterium]
MTAFAPIPRDVLGCLVAGCEKGGSTLAKDLIRHACRMRGCFEGGLLLADAPAEGIPEPYGTQLVASWALPATFLDDYRRCRARSRRPICFCGSGAVTSCTSTGR